MKHHRRPAQRKTRRLDARWLITGNASANILHHGQRAYLQPGKPGDHPKRYGPGQRLHLKPYVPGPTEAHVIVTSAERLTLGQVDDTTARELGYHDAADFRHAWIEANDRDWLEDFDGDLLLDTILARFEQRWHNKLAWLLRFRLDNTESPRLLAAGGSAPGTYREGTDGRWVYVERDNERESDRGYTSSDSLSLRDELPALTDEQWATHVGAASPFRERERLRAQRQARETLSLTERANAAKAAARAKGYDIRDETRRLDRLIEQGRADKARQQLALIERRVYPQAA